MAWAYVDESGTHPNGKMTRLTLGGCVATNEEWRKFEIRWSRVLGDLPPDRRVSMFHTADIEAVLSPSSKPNKKNEFIGWHRSQVLGFRDELLKAVETMDQVRFFGTSCDVKDPDAPLPQTYLDNVKSAILGAFYQSGGITGEPLSFMFARHPQVNAERVNRYVKMIGLALTGRIRDSTEGDPRKVLPLQVADLAAYEIAKFFPHRDLDQARSVFRRLRSRHSFLIYPQKAPIVNHGIVYLGSD